LGFSAVFTLFVVPAACLVAQRRGHSAPPPAAAEEPAVAESLIAP
jgi:hypothetical protein